MRLIDADALKRLVEDEWFDCPSKESFFDEIDRTPTIKPSCKECRYSGVYGVDKLLACWLYSDDDVLFVEPDHYCCDFCSRAERSEDE